MGISRLRIGATAAVGVISATLATAALAAPVLSGPSVAKHAQTASFKGQGFRPNLALTVAVKSPSGAESHHSAVTDAQGRLVHTVTATETGLYQIQVLSARGKPVLSTVLNVLE